MKEKSITNEKFFTIHFPDMLRWATGKAHIQLLLIHMAKQNKVVFWKFWKLLVNNFSRASVAFLNEIQLDTLSGSWNVLVRNVLFGKKKKYCVLELMKGDFLG